MKKTIIVGALLLLTGGTFVALNQGDTIPAENIVNIDFSPVEFAFSRNNLSFATSTDENDKEIKTGIKVPVSYDFPVATTTGFVVEHREEFVEMNFGAYNQCRGSGKLKVVCLGELNDDIEQNIETFKLNKAQELKELQESQYFNEINFNEL